MATVEPCITRQIRELENRFETQFTNVQEAMRGIGLQMSELTAARRHGGAGDGATRPATRLTRLDFPKFTRDDVESWIAKCERFFSLDGTQEGDKVSVASIALDDNSFRWFQSLEQGSNGRLTWPNFTEALKMRFSLEFDSPMEELKKLVQTGSLEAYQESFDNLVGRTALTESQKLQCYLGGLQQELCNGVKMFAPRTVLEATRIAKLQERSLDLLQKRLVPANRTQSSWSEKKNTVSNTFDKKVMPQEKKGIVEGSQKSILGKPAYTFQKKLSPKEMDEHRAQNLCFFCHDKFFPGHDCPQGKKCKFSLWRLGRKIN